MAILDRFYCILKNLANLVNTLYILSTKVVHIITVKPVLNRHLKIDKTKVLMENGSLMKVKVLQNAPLGAFCNTFDLIKR